MLMVSLAGLVPAAVFSRKLARMSGCPPEFLFSAAASITVLAAIYVVSNFGAAFEAIVMGGQRIDLTRKFNTVLTVCEAVAIIALLHAGYGLLAMTFVMGASEIIYIFCCYRVSHRVVPQMHVSMAHFTKTAFPELIRFAGSYQLVNVLELFYGAVVPIVLLKFFGADAAGIAALTGRLTSSVLIAQDALVLPILSGGAMVFASGSTETIRLFFGKSFKVTLAAALPPLAFVSAFGTSMIYAWTGQIDPKIRTAIWLTALAALLKAVSLLQLILYRASGRAVLDNIRQVLRIVAILIVAYFGRSLGFEGVLAGMAGAELVGVIFMFFVMAKTFHAFSARILTQDALRILAGTALVIGAGAAAGMIPIQWSAAERLTATIKLGEIGLGCMLMAWPALIVTKAVSGAERRTLLDAILPGRRKIVPANIPTVQAP
jgi:O-antigen/teichoic acid export membrane protein